MSGWKLAFVRESMLFLAGVFLLSVCAGVSAQMLPADGGAAFAQNVFQEENGFQQVPYASQTGQNAQFLTQPETFSGQTQGAVQAQNAGSTQNAAQTQNAGQVQPVNGPRRLPKQSEAQSRGKAKDTAGEGTEKTRLFSASDSQGASANAEDLPPKKFTFSTGMRKLIFAILLVTLLFMFLIFLLKKFSPKGVPQLPKDAFEVLGKSQLAYRHQVHLMKCGGKLFLVSVSPNGVDKIGEIEDPDEVEHVTKRCRGEVLGVRSLNSRQDEKDS